MGKKVKEIPAVGCLYGRRDWDRCGLFIDNGFFLEPGGKPEKNLLKNKRQILSSVCPTKCGQQDQAGYFDPVFRSLFINDPYIKKKQDEKKSYLDGPWIPPAYTKKSSTPGDQYGTILGKNYPAFSPVRRPKDKTEKNLPRNFVTSPSKKGSYGYNDICLNPYPEHTYKGIVDDYDEFEKTAVKKWKIHKAGFKNGPYKITFWPQAILGEPYESNPGPEYVVKPDKYAIKGKSRGPFFPPSYPKKPGNMHDGCFHKIPPWIPEKYLSNYEREKVLANKRKVKVLPALLERGAFMPPSGSKEYYIKSIVNNLIDFACNERTWRTMIPISYPQFNFKN